MIALLNNSVTVALAVFEHRWGKRPEQIVYSICHARLRAWADQWRDTVSKAGSFCTCTAGRTARWHCTYLGGIQSVHRNHQVDRVNPCLGTTCLWNSQAV